MAQILVANFLRKPFLAADLSAAVERLLEAAYPRRRDEAVSK